MPWASRPTGEFDSVIVVGRYWKMRKYNLYSALAVCAFIVTSCQSRLDQSRLEMHDNRHVLILPGYAVGSINLFTDRQGISNLYAHYEIRDTWVSPVIGWKYPVTSILDDGKPQLDIVWDMGVYFSGKFSEEVLEGDIDLADISFIRVYSPRYHGVNGIQTGMDLTKVEELLGNLMLFELTSGEYPEVYCNASKNVSLVFSYLEQESVQQESIYRGIRYWNQEISSNRIVLGERIFTLEFIDIQMEDSLLFLSRISVNSENSHEKQKSTETGPPRYMSVDTTAICIELPGLCSMKMLQEPIYDGYSYRPFVWVYVKNDGTVADNVFLMNSCGVEIIDSAAVSSARNSRWLPAIKENTSVGAWTVIGFDLMGMDL